MVLVIDNYDSFTYNLVQMIGETGAEVCVRRNNEVTVDEIRQMRPDHIVISPGPCTPDQAGVSMQVVQELAGVAPILGVCLGHQSIGQALGGRVVRARRLMHGKTSQVTHTGRGVFAGLRSPVRTVRYHSLAVERESLPDCLEVTAVSEDGEIMGIRHRSLPVEGVQFHPESILTEEGRQMIRNFLSCRTPQAEG